MDQFIPLREVAQRLQISVSSVRRYFDAGVLTGRVTPRGTRRISASSVWKLEAEMLDPDNSTQGITFP